MGCIKVLHDDNDDGDDDLPITIARLFFFEADELKYNWQNFVCKIPNSSLIMRIRQQTK